MSLRRSFPLPFFFDRVSQLLPQSRVFYIMMCYLSFHWFINQLIQISTSFYECCTVQWISWRQSACLSGFLPYYLSSAKGWKTWCGTFAKAWKKTKYTTARCLWRSFVIARLLLSCLLQVQGCPHWQAGLQLLLCSVILLERNNFFPPLLALHAALVQ